MFLVCLRCMKKDFARAILEELLKDISFQRDV